MIETEAPIESRPQAQLKFVFKWIDAPHYATDLSVYVFRPYGKHPQVKGLDLILTSTQYEQTRRTIVIVDSHNTLGELRRDDFPKRVLEDNSSGLSYTMRLFRVVCAKITAELVAFTTEACEEINFMVGVTLCENKRCARPNSPEGRLHPSGSKMHYLQHLEDCHRSAKDCCRANRRTLQVLLDQVNLIEGTRADDETNLINELKMAMKDLDYLHDEVDLSLQRIPGLRRDIREHLDMLQIRRTSILGILAGLYLPLSFVTVSS